jgi:hypothetical protein
VFGETAATSYRREECETIVVDCPKKKAAYPWGALAPEEDRAQERRFSHTIL